jgi:hypothetical protein
MIILLAMGNSLAGRDSRCHGQPGRTAAPRAASVLEMGEKGDRETGAAAGGCRDPAATAGIVGHRADHSARVAELQSEHRQPEQALHGSSPFTQRREAPMSRSRPRRRRSSGRSNLSLCSHNPPCPPASITGKQTGRLTTRLHVSVQAAGRGVTSRPCLATSESTRRTWSEFVTAHK